MKTKLRYALTVLMLSFVSVVQSAAVAGAGTASWWDIYQPKTPESLRK